MLRRLQELAQERATFAFESTLSSRTFAVFLKELKSRGYLVHLLYVWLNSPELSAVRVRHRVEAGGHDIPLDTIHRRYGRSVANFMNMYRPLANSWFAYDNSGKTARIVAAGTPRGVHVVRPAVWRLMQEQANAQAADNPQDA
jgi:predicted ABC-type ATPase